jgi:hypothetical protein
MLTAGGAKVGSGEVTFSEEGAAAGEAAAGSGRRVSCEERLAVAEAMDGPSRGELMTDAATTGSCKPGEVIGMITSVKGHSRAVGSGSRRVIRALIGTSTSSGTSEVEPFWRGGSSPLETSTTTGCEKRECN